MLKNCEVDTYPAVPRPITVLVSCVGDIVPEAMTIAPYTPIVVLRSWLVETYPTVPSPATVLVKLKLSPRLLTNPAVPSPRTVLVSSVGSINELI